MVESCPMSTPINNRIIHVPRRFVASEWGGTETVILEISRQQIQQGWKPEIFTSMALTDEYQSVIGGIQVHRFRYCYPFFGLSADDRLSMDKKGGNLFSLPLLWSLYKARNVRLFHAHSLKRLGGQVRTAARLRKKPYVVSLHGGVFDVPAAELDSMLKPISNKWEWGKPLGALLGSRKVLQDADYVICVGQSELDKAKNELSHNRITYLPNGVDTKKFAQGDGSAFRKHYNIPAESFFILNISRIDSQKNQMALLEAFRIFHKQHPQSILMLVGPETQPNYAARLRQFIHDSQLDNSCVMIPGLRNDDPQLLNAFHACDVFVLPSMHEPFGIVVLEAWSAGKPVIVSHVGGLKSLIREEVNGCFFSPEASDASQQLAQRIIHLYSEKELRARLAEAGQTEARNKYDWSQISQKLESIYLEAEHHAQTRYRNASRES